MKKKIEIEPGLTIPIEVHEEEGVHIITVDDIEWVKTDNYLHATVLFNMLADHITEYMSYSKR